MVANALSPAKVSEVYLYDEDATALVVVPDYQLSLAIGREGQNARLAARLTGWRIDIKSETQFAEEQAAFRAAYERGEVDEQGAPSASRAAEVPVASAPQAGLDDEPATAARAATTLTPQDRRRDNE